MLQFFRKYQKFFFLVITIVIIFSFSFFGTFSTFANPAQKKQDKVVGAYVDGSKMLQSEVQRMSYFISNDAEGNGHNLNLFNDNVILHDFIQTGLATLLAQNYFGVIEPKLASNWERMKKYKPYQHPEAPFISASVVWSRFAPGINAKLKELQNEQTFTTNSFSLLADLYREQSTFPSHYLKRILLYQQKQIPNINFDQRLYHDDVNLFGFHSVSDWFTGDFVDLMSEFILNTALLAKQQGYTVSEDVAKDHMVRTFQANAERLFPNDKPQDLLQRQLRSLGLDEKGAIKVWQTLLVFRNYMDSSAAGIVLDPLPFHEFGSYAGEKVSIERWDLPSSLQTANLADLFQLQLYLKAAYKKGEDPLDLPLEMLSAEAVTKHYPELVKRQYVVDIAETTLAEVGLKVKVKEMWEWQLEEKNWSLLQKEFPLLSDANNRKERFEALKGLEEEMRNKVDAFCVEKMVALHPEWIKETLAKKALKNQEIAVFPYSGEQVLAGIKDGAKLLTLLEEKELPCYSEDQKTFYRIVVQKKGEKDEVLSFEEAKNRGILATLLDKFLSKEYSKVRSKVPDKPFEEVKDEVGLLVFSDLIKAIDAEAKGSSITLKKEENPAAFYHAHRFSHYVQKQKEALKKGEVIPSHPWAMVKKEVTLTRQNEEFATFNLSSLHEGDWSDVQGGICFFYVTKKSYDEASHSKDKTMELLGNEAKRGFASRLLQFIEAKKAIAIPLLVEEEEACSKRS